MVVSVWLTFTLTTKDSYSLRTFLVGDNIEIHLVFTFFNTLFPFISKKYQACNIQGASWVKKKSRCKWIVRAF